MPGEETMFAHFPVDSTTGRKAKFFRRVVDGGNPLGVANKRKGAFGWIL